MGTWGCNQPSPKHHLSPRRWWFTSKELDWKGGEKNKEEMRSTALGRKQRKSSSNTYLCLLVCVCVCVCVFYGTFLWGVLNVPWGWNPWERDWQTLGLSLCSRQSLTPGFSCRLQLCIQNRKIKKKERVCFCFVCVWFDRGMHFPQTASVSRACSLSIVTYSRI